MPKVSFKSKLLKEVCAKVQLDMVLTESNGEFLTIFDNAIEDLITLQNSRCGIMGQRLLKSDEWYTTVLPEMDDFRFKQFLRVSRSDFSFILRLIENHEVFHGKNSSKQFPVPKQLAIALYKMGFEGSGSSLANVAALFGVSDGGTIMTITFRIIKAILSLEKNWIFWPSDDERKEICTHMADKLPHCIGYVDGTHIVLDEAPVDDPESYFSRKQRYSIQLQAICDKEKRIRNIVVGYPGSVHDARVFSSSEIGKNPLKFFSGSEWIAGDSAYRITKYLITPFRRNATDGNYSQRKQFNKYFSGYRVNIECCFGKLKEVFSSLKGLRIRVDRNSGHKKACEWITACCVLYNIILPSLNLEPEEPMEDEEDQGNANNDSHVNEGHRKRQNLLNFVITKIT